MNDECAKTPYPPGVAANKPQTISGLGGTLGNIGHKLYSRKSRLEDQLHEVNRAIEAFETDISVQKFLSVIEVANK